MMKIKDSFPSTISAFTLAEVLVTLAIIGVVAAFSIPALLNNTNKQEYIVALKKFYATANHVMQKIALDNCGTSNMDCFWNGEAGGWDIKDHEAFANAVKSGFNVVKDCGTGTGCWADSTSLYYTCSKDDTMDLNSKSDGDFGFVLGTGGLYKFLTADGMSVGIVSHSLLNGGKPSYSPNYLIGSTLFVDVNGKKNPNCFGKDVFIFNISGTVPAVTPLGSKDDPLHQWEGVDLPCTALGGGVTCTGRIFDEGWVMNY